MNITRHEFLKTMGVCSAGLAGSFLVPGRNISAASETGKKPNVIFIFADDMGWGDLPCYGHQSVTAHGGWIVRGELKMPNLDRMASEGTLFTRFYVNSGVCSPSRTGLMTGQFPGRLGIHDYLADPGLNTERGMPDYVETSVPNVTKLMRDAGYRTGHFGKWHLGSGSDSPKPEEYGIDVYKPCNNGPKKRVGSTEMIADETIKFIESGSGDGGDDREKPFYINAWLYDPHSPLRPTEEMMEPYKHLSPRFGDNKGALEIWYAVLSDIDKHVGRILDKLDELGLSENTVVVFSSDNGPESGLIPFISHYGGASSTNTGPFRGVKRSLYEGGIREPFIVRWPGTTPAGQVDNYSVISGVDWLPTVCNLAGVKLPGGKNFDGENLSLALKGTPVKKTKPQMWENRFPVYGHVLHKSPILAIRVDNWKLLMNPDRSRVELYDIPNDPSELNNLADRKPEIVKKLSEQVLEWQATLPEGPYDENAGSNAYPWPENK
ncbi:sulfatase [Candidatus Latescibacterota bacterium]